MRKFRLLKDLPDAKAGTIYTKDVGDQYRPPDDPSPVIECNSYFAWQVENNTSWFEEVKEDEKRWTDADMKRFLDEYACTLKYLGRTSQQCFDEFKKKVLC